MMWLDCVLHRVISKSGAAALAMGIFVLFQPANGYALDCAVCSKHQLNLFSLEKSLNETNELRKKNEAYLDTLPATETAKRAKISSNIFSLNMRAEIIENKYKLISDEVQNMRCGACRKTENPYLPKKKKN